MKKTIFILTLSIISTNLIAQNLSMGQILEIKKKDLGNAEEYLTAKGWEFKNAKEPSKGNMGRATFTYNKSNLFDLAESFFNYYYSGFSNITRISIQIHKKAKYNEYIAAIKGYGCKLIKSKVKNGNIVKVYRGATTTFEVTSGTSENKYYEENAAWSIIIVSNEDYDLNFVKE